jgi:hypothetical protein
VIPNLEYTYPQGYEPGYLGARKKLNNGRKKAKMSTYKFEITETILITNILLIWCVQFMEIGCQGVRE